MARTAKAALGISVTAQNEADAGLKDAAASIADVGEAAEDAGTSVVELSAVTDLLGKAWGVLSSLASGAAGTIAELTTEAMAGAKAERDLTAALQAQGAIVDEVLPGLLEFNASLQQQTGVSGGALAAMQAQMAALGVLPGQLQTATVAALGWSRATGKGMAEAGRDVIKVLRGKVEVVNELGANVTSTEAALRFMARSFNQLSADGQTLEGQLRILGENWSGFREALGSTVTESDAAAGSVNALSGFVLQLQDIFKSPEAFAAVDGLFRRIAGGASATITLMLRLMDLARGDTSAQLAKLVDTPLIPDSPFKAIIQYAIDAQSKLKALKKTVQLEVKGFIAEEMDLEAERFREAITKLGAQFEDIASGKFKLPKLEAPKLPDFVGPELPADIAEERRKEAIEQAKRDAKAARDRIAANREEYQAWKRQMEEQKRYHANWLKEKLDREQKAAEAAANLRETLRKIETEREKAENEQRFAEELEEFQKKQDAAKKHAEEMKRLTEDVSNALVRDAFSAFSRVGDVVNGHLVTMGDAFEDFVDRIMGRILEFLAEEAVKALIRLLASAISQGAQGSQGAGPRAPAEGGGGSGAFGAVGSAVGSAIGQVVSGLFARGGLVRRFAGGGFVDLRDGTRGRDSVRALLTPGEYVIPEPIVSAIRRGAPPPTSVLPRPAQAGSVTNNYQVHMAPLQLMALPPSYEVDRYYRDNVMRVQARLSRFT